jgi:hypothetical protein
MANTIPTQVKKFFWGDDLSQLSWQSHRQYIIQTLLNKGDEKSISWLLQKTGSKQLKNMLPKIKLDPKSANFWSLYFS